MTSPKLQAEFNRLYPKPEKVVRICKKPEAELNPVPYIIGAYLFTFALVGCALWALSYV